MLAEFGSVPICLELDFDSFDGPPHWVARLRRTSGWLLVAEATIQSEHDILTERLVVACDERENPIPSFKAANLLNCEWLNPTCCDELPPDVLDDLMCEEEGALISRWHREKNSALAKAFETQEIRVAELEARVRSMMARNEAQIAELRQRRRHPDATPEMRAIMAQIIAELDDENDELLAEMAETRAAIRDQSADIEDALWVREDLLIEVQSLHLVRWHGLRRLSYAPPYYARPVSALWTPEQSRPGVATEGQQAINGSLRAAQLRGLAARASSSRSENVHPAETLTRHECVAISPPVPTEQVERAESSAADRKDTLDANKHVMDKDGPSSALDVAQQPPNAGWTTERVSLLQDMWFAGHTAREIARALGNTSRNAVLSKAERLGLPRRGEIVQDVKDVGTNTANRSECHIGQQQGTGGSHWSPERIGLLEQHWLAGTPAEDIARVLGLRRGQIIGKAHRLGLSNEARPRRREEESAEEPLDATGEAVAKIQPTAVDNALSALSAARKRYFGKK